METSNDDPGTTKRPGRARSRVWWRRGAGVLLVVAFAYAMIYGCGTFLIEGIDPNTKPERFTGPRSDIPITQARADTLNLLLTIYDTLTRDHIVDAWVPPAPGPGGGGYQARIGGEYNEPVCPEGTTNEIYALAEATETTPGSLHSEHAVWSAWCFSDWGSFSFRESIGWRPCQQRNTQTSSRPKWCVR